jgi:adenine-specific DNA-methyltransferase
VTLGLLAARIAFEADATPATSSLRRIELVLGDYLDQLEDFYASGRPGPVLALGNPPYTRVQELPLRDREKAAVLAVDIIDSGHANLAMLFQAATFRHMRAADVSCMVLPGSFSYTRASRALRTALWESRRPIEMHRTPATAKAFTGRAVQAAVLLVGAERNRRPPLRLARVQTQPGSVDVLERWIESRAGPQPDNWFWSSASAAAADRKIVRLGTVATIRRGTATGANGMFFLTDAEAAVLPEDVVVRAIPSLRRFNGDDLTAAEHAALGDKATKRWLLAIPPDYTLDGALRDYVDRHAASVGQRHLVNQRSPWYSITELPRPQLLFSPLSKTAFKVVVNTVVAVPSNNLFGITLRDDGDPRRLAAWLRSDDGQTELRRLSRRYPGGSLKLEPGSLCAVEVPVAVLKHR